MALGVPTWMEWALRIVAWSAWQLFVLFFAFLVYASLFSEYGAYSHPLVDPVAAVLFFIVALYIGTWVPVRRWRVERRIDDEGGHADRHAGGA